MVAGGDEKAALKVFEGMPRLGKLCLAGCGIATLPSEWFLPMVAELRLSRNAIEAFEEGVLLRSVKILDVAHNGIRDVRTLRRAKYLESLSISGNPCVGCPTDAAHTARVLRRMFPLLRHVTGIDSAEEVTPKEPKRESERSVEDDDIVIEAPTVPQSNESVVRKVRRMEQTSASLRGAAVAERLLQDRKSVV